MVESVSDFLNDHSERFIEMALSTHRQEVVQNPDGYGKNTGDCGDTVEMYLTVRNRRVEYVSYRLDGCISSNACANTVAHLAEGRPIEESWKITPDRVIDYLETLPPELFHCAELAVGALYRALADYGDIQRHPWKKSYR